MKKIIENRTICIFVFLGIIIISCFIYSINKNAQEEQKLNIYIEEQNIIEQNEENENKIILHIAGEVERQGIIELNEGERIQDAITAAGGATEEANLSKINLAYKVKDGQKIYIPNINDNDINEDLLLKENNEEETLININTANQTELETLSGIGPSTALKIINYRKTNGNFKKTEEIMDVDGIGEAKYESIKDYICVK